MLALIEWGSERFSPEGRVVQLCERGSGRAVRVGVVDLDTGQAITPDSHVIKAGPAADASIKKRFAHVEAK